MQHPIGHRTDDRVTIRMICGKHCFSDHFISEAVRLILALAFFIYYGCATALFAAVLELSLSVGDSVLWTYLVLFIFLVLGIIVAVFIGHQDQKAEKKRVAQSGSGIELN